jgi:hypothetical protein
MKTKYFGFEYIPEYREWSCYFDGPDPEYYCKRLYIRIWQIQIIWESEQVQTLCILGFGENK